MGMLCSLLNLGYFSPIKKFFALISPLFRILFSHLKSYALFSPQSGIFFSHYRKNPSLCFSAIFLLLKKKSFVLLFWEICLPFEILCSVLSLFWETLLPIFNTRV